MIFEYNDCDGYTYVIFSLWDVIIYKIQICKHSAPESNLVHLYTLYLYHADGTQNGTIFAHTEQLSVSSVTPDKGIRLLFNTVKSRLSKLGERDLSREYLKNTLNKIQKLLPQYKNGAISLAMLLDFEHNDRIFPLYIVEQIFEQQEHYNLTKSFTENMQQILGVNDRFLFSDALKKEVLQRYMKMDQDGTFITMAESAIHFFESTCCTNNSF